MNIIQCRPLIVLRASIKNKRRCPQPLSGLALIYYYEYFIICFYFVVTRKTANCVQKNFGLKFVIFEDFGCFLCIAMPGYKPIVYTLHTDTANIKHDVIIFLRRIYAFALLCRFFPLNSLFFIAVANNKNM